MSTPVWRVVAEREVTTRLRDKAFLIASSISVIFLVGLFVVSAIIGGGSSSYDVAVTRAADGRAAEASQALLRASGSPDATVEVHEAGDPAAAERLVRDGDADAALLPAGQGLEIVGDDAVDPSLRAALAQAVGSAAVSANADAQGVDLAALQRGAQVGERLLDPNASESDARQGVAFAFSILFFMTAVGLGMTIAQSVVQEKESRIVEILAAAVPVRAMLWGKILGNTVLALGQALLLAVVGVAGLLATGRKELLTGVGWAVVWYLVFFVLGFLTLASLWAVAGSLASRQEDLGATTLPGQLVLLAPYLVSVLAGDKVRELVSMVPIASTMIMPGRMARGEVPWWQVAVAVALTLALAVVLVRLGTRIYERTLLRTGGRIGYAEALRLRPDAEAARA